MASASVPKQPGTPWQAHHVELARAHQEAIMATRELYESLDALIKVDLKAISVKCIDVARALQNVAETERNCGLVPVNHCLGKLHQEMLEHQRLAYIDFEQLSAELEENASPVCNNILRFAADIEHHIQLAELANQAILNERP